MKGSDGRYRVKFVGVGNDRPLTWELLNKALRRRRSDKFNVEEIEIVLLGGHLGISLLGYFESWCRMAVSYLSSSDGCLYPVISILYLDSGLLIRIVTKLR